MANKFITNDIVFHVTDFEKKDPLVVVRYKYISLIGAKFVDTEDVVCTKKIKNGKIVEVTYNQNALTK